MLFNVFIAFAQFFPGGEISATKQVSWKKTAAPHMETGMAGHNYQYLYKIVHLQADSRHR